MPAQKRKPQPRKPKARILPPAKARARGRPEHEPTQATRTLVETLSGMGASVEFILAKLLQMGIEDCRSETTLQRHYKGELARGPETANMNVTAALYRIITKKGGGAPSVTGAIWWEKTRQGRKEIVVNEHTGKIEQVSRKMTAREAAEAYASTRRRPRKK